MLRRKNPTSRQKSFTGTPSPQEGAPAVLWWIVGAMALIEIVIFLADSVLADGHETRWIAFRYGAFWQPVFSGELPEVFPGQAYSMLISHAFLHAGFLHLLMNSVVLLALGKEIVGQIGSGKVLLILLLSALAGGLMFGLISSSNGPMIGASGAVFGLIGVWQAWDFRLRQQHGLPFGPVLNAVFALLLANVILFLVLEGGLAWEAHLGGWLVGAGAALSFARQKAGQ